MRTQTTSTTIWSKARASSIILLGFSLIALLFVIKTSVDFIVLKTENIKLEQLKQRIINENIELTTNNPYLEDENYFSIYARDDYLFDGNKFIKINK